MVSDGIKCLHASLHFRSTTRPLPFYFEFLSPFKKYSKEKVKKPTKHQKTLTCTYGHEKRKSCSTGGGTSLAGLVGILIFLNFFSAALNKNNPKILNLSAFPMGKVNGELQNGRVRK
jgi:hypothetical protein